MPGGGRAAQKGESFLGPSGGGAPAMMPAIIMFVLNILRNYNQFYFELKYSPLLKKSKHCIVALVKCSLFHNEPPHPQFS